MGNNFKESKFNQNIDFSVKLEKICYFPGENISGTLFLMGKPGLIETQLIEPKALFTIYEKQRFDYANSNNKTSIEETENKIENYALFNNFIGANLLTGLSIPFTFQIPFTIHPTCSFLVDKTPGYSKHFFSAEFPNLNVKRTLAIVIKNNANFTMENNLLKMPCNYFKKISKLNFLVSKGNFSISINLPKNVFYYDEPIPYEIILDLKNLNLTINKIELSIKRNKRQNYKSNFNRIRSSEINILVTKNIELNQNLKEQVIKNELYFPLNSINENFIFPPLVYQYFETNDYFFPKKSLDNPRYKIPQFEKKFFVYPSCINSLISVDYFLEVKLYFPSSLTTDEIINIPLDFLTRPVENQINNIKIIDQNNPYNYNNANNNSFGQNNPYNYNNINNNVVGQNIPYYYNNVNNNFGNQTPNSQEDTPSQNNNNKNFTIGENNNNLNSQEQNKNFNVNEEENTAPPPVLNYNNNNNI